MGSPHFQDRRQFSHLFPSRKPSEVNFHWSTSAASWECAQVRHGLLYWVVFSEALRCSVNSEKKINKALPPVGSQPNSPPQLNTPVLEANEDHSSGQMTCGRQEGLVNSSDHTFGLSVKPRCFFRESVLNFPANWGEQDLSRKAYEEGIIPTGWWAKWVGVSQSDLPNYVFFKGLYGLPRWH